MHDILVSYLEVNFTEIAEQLAQAKGAEPASAAAHAEAAQQLRGLLRRLAVAQVGLRPEPEQPVTDGHDQAHVMSDLRPIVEGFSEADRQVLGRYFEMFWRSMARARSGAAVSAPSPREQIVPVEVPTPTRAPGATAPEPAHVRLKEPESPPPPVMPEPAAAAPHTILLAAAQQALDLLQVDASQAYTVMESGRFALRAAVPADVPGPQEANGVIDSPLLTRALAQADARSVEDLAREQLTPDETAWLRAGYQGLAAVSVAPPLDRATSVLVLFRRSPWRLDRNDAVRLEDLALEVGATLGQQSLAAKVEEAARLQERLKLAREIHDGLASDLAAVVALFKHYQQRREKDPQAAAEMLPQLRSLTEEILQGARDILQSLRPTTVRSQGLAASVRQLVDQFGRMHLVEAAASIHGEENGLTSEQKEAIFQVLRESLSNVRKHAHARSVRVTLDLSATPWVLTVSDDGRGFDPRQVIHSHSAAGSYGLIGMRERAGLLDGTLEIVSRPGEGTQITLIGPAERNG